MDFTNIFIKIYGFFFMEIYSLLFKNKTEQDKQTELKLLPQMRVWFENSNLAEKENINSISTKLYNVLKELEKQNISEKESNRKTGARVLELKKQTEYIPFERNQFKSISYELCVELKKKVAEMESKYMLEKTIKQEQMIKILELEKQIEDITLEKNKLECIVADLHTELFTSYQDKLDKLVSENMKVPALCKNEETENIRDNNSLLYDHECIYKEKMTIFIEETKCLLSEFNELFSNLMDKIEENVIVKEQCNIIKCKIEQLLTINLAENSILKIQSPEPESIKYLKAENDTLKAEIVELKERVKVLAEENAQFSTNQLETTGNLDSSCNERSSNTSLHLLTTYDNDAEKNKTEHEIPNVNTCEILLSKVTTLQGKIDHPTHLNEKLVTNQRSELFDSNIIRSEKEELHYLKKHCDELKKENVQTKELEQQNALKIKELEALTNNLQTNIRNQESHCRRLEEKLLLKREQEEYSLMHGIQSNEIETVDFKNNLETNYKSEVDSVIQRYQQFINKYENNMQKLNDNLNKYNNETLNLTEKLAFLHSIEEKFNEMVAEKEYVFHQQKILINDNQKLNRELSDIRKCMINELTSLKCNENSIDFSNKSVNEIFVVLLHSLVSKEKEVIMTMQEKYERAMQKVENEKQQWINVVKCATTMAKELKSEIERFQTEKESIHADYKDQIHQLKHILRKSINEKKVFKKELYKGIRNGKIEL
ncbi:unnamed protein product [Xylocopa violacea]|uniref:Uncharacterized protein n=1 Tax=Xylocopa violacea TaxID=135666 RepID=A0ABP1NZ96_XYLVO